LSTVFNFDFVEIKKKLFSYGIPYTYIIGSLYSSFEADSNDLYYFLNINETLFCP